MSTSSAERAARRIQQLIKKGEFIPGDFVEAVAAIIREELAQHKCTFDCSCHESGEANRLCECCCMVPVSGEQKGEPR